MESTIRPFLRAKYELAKAVKKSRQLKRSLELGKLVAAEPGKFADVHTYVMFIGYPRSGHSLVGETLNAHPNAVICNELHALREIENPLMTKEKLFAAIIERDQWFAERDFRSKSYSYKVQGQWQGNYERLEIIGDKRGGGSARYLAGAPEQLDKLLELLGPDINFKIIHVVRNPFDNVGSMMRHAQKNQAEPFEHAFADYAILIESANRAMERFPQAMLTIHHEDFVLNTKETLRKIWAFIGAEVTEDYLNACDDLVFDSPSKARHRVDWTQEQIQRVYAVIAPYSHLNHYGFDD